MKGHNTSVKLKLVKKIQVHKSKGTLKNAIFKWRFNIAWSLKLEAKYSKFQPLSTVNVSIS